MPPLRFIKIFWQNNSWKFITPARAINKSMFPQEAICIDMEITAWQIARLGQNSNANNFQNILTTSTQQISYRRIFSCLQSAYILCFALMPLQIRLVVSSITVRITGEYWYKMYIELCGYPLRHYFRSHRK